MPNSPLLVDRREAKLQAKDAKSRKSFSQLNYLSPNRRFTLQSLLKACKSPRSSSVKTVSVVADRFINHESQQEEKKSHQNFYQKGQNKTEFLEQAELIPTPRAQANSPIIEENKEESKIAS